MDVEQTVKFILDQQQRLGAHMERLDAHLERVDGHLERLAVHLERLTLDHQRLADYVERIARGQLQLAEMQRGQEERIGELAGIVRQLAEAHTSLAEEFAAHQRRTDQRFQELAERSHELAEAQQHTDHNLNALIKIVDDLIRRGGSLN